MTAVIKASDNVKVRFACSKGELSPTRDPLCMRKEWIYEGRHEDGNKRQFTVTKDTIKYWVKAFNEVNAMGLEIPAPISASAGTTGEHPENIKDAQEQSQGVWISCSEGVRPDGLACINGTIKFKDEATRDALKNSDISIFAENNYTAPNGKVYSTCITHAMFTDNPAIPGLSGFIACSRVEKPKAMDILEYCRSIELVGQEATEEDAIAALQAAIAKGKETVEASEEEETEEEKKKREEEEEKAKLAASKTATNKEPMPETVKAIAASRRAQIENLQLKRKLDPKTAKEYLTEYTNDKRVTSDLKQGNDAFDKLVIACSRLPDNANLPNNDGGTGAQGGTSKDKIADGPKADAQRRLEQAKSRR